MVKKKSSKHYNFGIVGTGDISNSHIEAIKNSSSNIIGVFSHDKKRAKSFAKKHDIDYYDSYPDMLNDKRVDAIDIITYNNLHANYAISAINHNKHVILEKPIDINYSKAKKLVDLSNKKNLTLSCISQFRFSKGIQKLKQLTKEDYFGKINKIDISLTINRNDQYFEIPGWRGKKEIVGGGILIMNVIHLLDILVWLFGPIRSMDCRMDNLRKKFHKIEDTLRLILKFNDNIACKIYTTNLSDKTEPIKINRFGTKNSLTIENFEVLKMEISEKNIQNSVPDLNKVSQYCYNLQFKDFINSIEYNKTPQTTGKDALYCLKVIDKLYKNTKGRFQLD